jgi:hypothetical protein
MTWTACVSALKEAMAGRSLHVMVLLQGIKKLFDLHQDDLDCVSAIKVAMELQVEACMKEEDEVAAATHRHLQPEEGHPEGKEGLSGR